MGGKGTCPCCKQWKELTEHHIREYPGENKVMLCVECHRVVEEYLRIVSKEAEKD